MNKDELLRVVAKKACVPHKVANDVLNTFLNIIVENVCEGKRITLVGFGSFEPRKRDARIGRNPQTGAEIQVPAKTVPGFVAGKKFKDMFN